MVDSMAGKWKKYESSWEPYERLDDLSSEDLTEPALAEAPSPSIAQKPQRRRPKKIKRSSKASNEDKLYFYPMDGLNYLCELLPGGMTTAIEFARLAGIEDERFKNLVSLYDRLTYQQKVWLQLEDLCSQVGIQKGKFIGMLCRFGYDIGFDVMTLMRESLRICNETGKLVYALNNPDDHKARSDYLKERGLI